MDSRDAAGVTRRLPIALTVAGSDSGAGAGIQADLKTFAAFGVYGASVVTALTAQNTRSVRRLAFSSPEMVADQIDLVLEDFDVAAVKIGMLGVGSIIEVVAERLASLNGRSGDGRPPERSSERGGETVLPLQESRPKGRIGAFIVYDPVMAASLGVPLSGASFVETVRASLLPLVDCLTPNLAEAGALLGERIARSEADMARQGEALLKLGPRAVLMKGGHLESDEAVDLLATNDGVHRFAAPRLASKNLHGTGCTLSSAIAADIILGASLPKAVASAKKFVRQSIERGRDVTLGAGAGPLIQTELRSKL